MEDRTGRSKASAKRKIVAGSSLLFVFAIFGFAVDLYTVPNLTLSYYRELFGDNEETATPEDPTLVEDSSNADHADPSPDDENSTEEYYDPITEVDPAPTEAPSLGSISIEIETRDNWNGERVGDNIYQLEEGELNFAIDWITLDENGQQVHEETCDMEIIIENVDSLESQAPRRSADCSGTFSPNYGGFPRGNYRIGAMEDHGGRT